MKQLATLIILLALCGVTACHKTGSSVRARFTGCRIMQVVETANGNSKTAYTFSYNDDGTVSSIKSADVIADKENFVREFIYGPKYMRIGVFTANESDPGWVLGEDSLVLDDQKRVTDIYENAGPDTQQFVSYHYQYSAAGDLVSFTDTYFGGQYFDSFQYQNGDDLFFTQTIRSGGKLMTQSSFYYFYDSSSYNVGNICALMSDFERYGMAIQPVNHRRTKVYSSYSLTTSYYQYMLDDKGHIIQMSMTDQNGGKSVTDITYACE